MTKADLVEVVAKKASLTAKASREAVVAVFGAITDALKKGDKIVTSGGIYGLIDEVRSDTVTVKIAENIRVKLGKGYIIGLRESDDD